MRSFLKNVAFAIFSKRSSEVRGKFTDKKLIEQTQSIPYFNMKQIKDVELMAGIEFAFGSIWPI